MMKPPTKLTVSGPSPASNTVRSALQHGIQVHNKVNNAAQQLAHTEITHRDRWRRSRRPERREVDPVAGGDGWLDRRTADPVETRVLGGAAGRAVLASSTTAGAGATRWWWSRSRCGEIERAEVGEGDHTRQQRQRLNLPAAVMMVGHRHFGMPAKLTCPWMNNGEPTSRTGLRTDRSKNTPCAENGVGTWTKLDKAKNGRLCWAAALGGSGGNDATTSAPSHPTTPHAPVTPGSGRCVANVLRSLRRNVWRKARLGGDGWGRVGARGSEGQA